MKRYRTNDGETLSASSPHELLEKLWLKSRTHDDSLEGFKAELLRRVETQVGAVLSNDNDDVIVDGLVATGLLVELEPIGD